MTTNDATFSLADLAGMTASILSDDPFDCDEDQARDVLWCNFEAVESSTLNFDPTILPIVYMITRHPAYDENMKAEFIGTVSSIIEEIYEED